MDSIGPLVDVDWLRERLGAPRLLVVDCRWKLGEPGAGERQYGAGHVPGAVFLDVDRDLSGPPAANGGGGRHPLPPAAQFERTARAAGISSDTRVVAYDDAGTGGAARLWWLLRHFGHDSAAILDGGVRAWRAAGAPLEPGPPVAPPPGDFRARERSDDIVPLEELRDRVLSGDGTLTLLDARAPERYRGDREPVDPVAGHIPGARNVPFASLMDESGRFRPPAELRELIGTGDLAAYCGSGVTAATLVAAAEAVGGPGVRLYAGSWSEWCRLGLPPER